MMLCFRDRIISDEFWTGVTLAASVSLVSVYGPYSFNRLAGNSLSYSGFHGLFSPGTVIGGCSSVSNGLDLVLDPFNETESGSASGLDSVTFGGHGNYSLTSSHVQLRGSSLDSF